MLLISHRGNLLESNPKLENKPSYIEAALNLNYDCEVDVFYDKGWWLGHDEAQYKISYKWILDNSEKLWIHCKRWTGLEAIQKLEKTYNLSTSLNYFFHHNDDYTLTSKGFIWCLPNRTLIKNSICVLPEEYYSPIENKVLKNCLGICSDQIEIYKSL